MVLKTHLKSRKKPHFSKQNKQKSVNNIYNDHMIDELGIVSFKVEPVEGLPQGYLIIAY